MEKEAFEELKKQLDRCHVIIFCFIAFFFLCAILVFVYLNNSDIQMTKEIVRIETEEGSAIYQNGDYNTISEKSENGK